MLKRSSFFTLIILLTLCIGTGKIMAQSGKLIGESSIQFAMPILIVSPDARAGGLGDVGVATSPTASAQNWNAAKYAFIESKSGAALSYIPWLRNVGASNINLLYLTGYYKFDDKNSIGAGLRYFSVGSLDFIGIDQQLRRTTNPNEWAFDASYTRLLTEDLSMSLTGRYIYSDLTGGARDDREINITAASAIAADIGIYYNKPIFLGSKTGSISVGAAISNIGTKMSYSPNSDVERSYFLPTTLRIGAEWLTNFNFYHDVGFNLELSKYLVPTPPTRDANGNITGGKEDNVGVFQGMIQSFYDAPDGLKEEMQEIMIGVGVEYICVRQFMARLGYYYDHKSANRKYLTIGAGMRYQMFTLDLAYLIPTAYGFSNPLANTIHITLSVDFGKISRQQTTVSKDARNTNFFNY